MGGSGFRLTGEIASCGCLPKDNKEEMLRFAGMIGRPVAAGLGGEEREDFLGGNREDSILRSGLDSAFAYSLTDIIFDRGSSSMGQPPNDNTCHLSGFNRRW